MLFIGLIGCQIGNLFEFKKLKNCLPLPILVETIMFCSTNISYNYTILYIIIMPNATCLFLLTVRN